MTCFGKKTLFAFSIAPAFLWPLFILPRRKREKEVFFGIRIPHRRSTVDDFSSCGSRYHADRTPDLHLLVFALVCFAATTYLVARFATDQTTLSFSFLLACGDPEQIISGPANVVDKALADGERRRFMHACMYAYTHAHTYLGSRQSIRKSDID